MVKTSKRACVGCSPTPSPAFRIFSIQDYLVRGHFESYRFNTSCPCALVFGTHRFGGHLHDASDTALHGMSQYSDIGVTFQTPDGIFQRLSLFGRRRISLAIHCFVEMYVSTCTRCTVEKTGQFSSICTHRGYEFHQDASWPPERNKPYVSRLRKRRSTPFCVPIVGHRLLFVPRLAFLERA